MTMMTGGGGQITLNRTERDLFVDHSQRVRTGNYFHSRKVGETDMTDPTSDGWTRHLRQGTSSVIALIIINT